jgi:2-dehydropantoate 2-reductase
MRIHIVGSGAIGGMAGAYMAMNGEDVTFVDQWDEHVAAMQRDGLQIDGVRGRHQLRVRAITPERIEGALELVFVATKSQHTESAIDAIRPHLADATTVVSLQNGFNAMRVADMLGQQRVIGTIPDYTAALVDPGRLEFTVDGPVYVGELDGSTTERVREVQRLLSYLTTTHLTDNIVGRIWTKQCYMSWIVMTALVDASFTEVMSSDRNKLLGVALVRETIPIADRAGVTLERDAYFQPDLLRQRTPDARRAQIARIDTLSAHFQRRRDEQLEQASSTYQFVKKGSGMWWDIVYRRRPSETRWITGALVDKAEAFGIPVPLNTALTAMIYEIEDGKRSQGWQNIDELAALAESLDEPLSVEV